MKNESDCESVDQKTYQKTYGCFLHFALCTQIDTFAPVLILAGSRTTPHVFVMSQQNGFSVFRSTMNYGITFNHGDLETFAFVESDHGNYETDRMSMSVFVVKIADAPFVGDCKSRDALGLLLVSPSIM